MEKITIRCAACNKTTDIGIDLDKCFCTHCGVSIELEKSDKIAQKESVEVKALYDTEKPEDLAKDKRVFIFLSLSFVILTVALVTIIILLLVTEQEEPDSPYPMRNITYEINNALHLN